MGPGVDCCLPVSSEYNPHLYVPQLIQQLIVNPYHLSAPEVGPYENV